MNKQRLIKNIFFLILLSFALTALSLVFIVFKDHQALKTGTQTKLNLLGPAIVEGMRTPNYIKLQSLLYIIDDERFERINLYMPNMPGSFFKNIYIGQVPPIKENTKDFFLVYSVKDMGREIAQIRITSNWWRITKTAIKNIAPVIIALNILILLTTFIAQLPHLLHSNKLTLLLKFLANYDGSDEKRKMLVNTTDNSSDKSLRKIVSAIASVIEKEKEFSKNEYRNKRLIDIGQMAAQVAHDVRKPLSVMGAMVAMLPSKKNDEQFVGNMAQTVGRSISQTNAMLNDILEFSRDAQVLEQKDQDPQSIITSALSDVLRDHTRAEIEIEYNLRHKNYLYVDGNRITRVFMNVISNAVEAMYKTTDENEIAKGKIWIRTEDVSSPSPVMQITIGNNGLPIPEDVSKKIFDPFFTYNKKGGTGLGLAICQKVVEMHGGKIEVRVPPVSERGVEFIIELPAHIGSLEVNEAELIHRSNELKMFHEEEKGRSTYGDTANTEAFMQLHKLHGREMYMLIVDDEPLFRETIRSLLEQLSQVRDHVRVIESGSAETALKLFEAREFDYVIADIDMGKRCMNGYEFAHLVLKKYQNTRVLIHSNKRVEELDRDIRKIKSNRFMGFLPKPMTQPELLQFLACKTFESDVRNEAGDKKRDEQDQNKKNVLVVNDDESLLAVFRILIEENGKNEVCEAASVKDAQEILTQKKIDIILSDINLGQKEPSGYDLLRFVRETNKTMPFYITSGYSRAEEESRAISLGASGYLQLPIEDEELNEILRPI